MSPVDFNGSNCVYAKDQPEYLPIPVLRMPDGTVMSCWRLSMWERFKLLITGRLFLIQLTFNQALQPLVPTVKNPIVFKPEQSNAD